MASHDYHTRCYLVTFELHPPSFFEPFLDMLPTTAETGEKLHILEQFWHQGASVMK